MYPKFNLSRTSIVILTLVGAIVFAFASLIAFEQWPAQKETVRPVETTPRPNDSSGTEVNGGVDGPMALRGDEASKPLKPETHESPADEIMLTPLSKNGSPAWPQDQKQPERRSPAFNQSLISPLDRTKASAGIPDLMESVRAGSTARVEEPQKKSEGRKEKGPRGDHPDEAVRFRNMQMQDENGEIPLDGLQKAREQMDLMRDFQQKKTNAAGKPEGMEVAGIDPGGWSWLGPGNIGGRIRSIVIHPVDPNRMWVGSVSGGIWYTTNAGGSWAPVNDFMANLVVSTMVMDPTNSNVMYAGTGESFGIGPPEGENIAANGLRGDGIFKSTDGGVTWNQLLTTNPADPAVCGGGGFACQWSYVNRLAMSADGTTILAATGNGIWRSTDGGAIWNSNGTFVPLGTNPFQDIDFDPTNSLQAIASSPGGSSYSTTGGVSWLNAAYAAAPGDVVVGGSLRVELAYAPSNPLIVYASVDQYRLPQPPSGTPAVQGDLFLSNDGGRIFTRINTVLSGATFLGAIGFYANIIWVNPLDPTFIIVGGINMYRSTDGGINWTGMANGASGSAHSDHHMIVAHPGFNNTTNKIVYFTNDGGIYKTDDVSTAIVTATTSTGWTELNNNLGVTQFYGAAANADGIIVGGTQDNGNLRFTGLPNSWAEIPGMGGDGGFVAADPADPNFFYGQYIYLQISRSTNAGVSGTNIFSGITDAGDKTPNPQTSNFIAPFVLDPNNANTMLAGGMSLWRSNDVKAATPAWTAIKPPLSNGLMPPTNVPISAVAVSTYNPDFIVVGHNVGQIFITFDGTGINPPPTQQPPGQPCPLGFSPCWSRISIPAITPSRFVTRLVIDETRSPNWIYATFGGFADNNVYVTKDLGSTWIDVTGAAAATGLPSVPVRSLVINPVRPNFLYVGTEVGIFASEDGGATWGLPQDGPAKVSVDELFWLNGDLVAVTYGRGLYKTSSSVYTYNFPNCLPGGTPPCTCFGNWDCPCNWPGGQVPTINDDVVLSCSTTVSLPAQARNLTVGNHLTLNAGIQVAEDVYNVGNIQTTTGGGNLSARNLVNSRPRNVVSLAGVIQLPQLSTSGDVTNAGIIALSNNLTCRNLRTTQDSTLTLFSLNVGGNLINNSTTLLTLDTLNVVGDLTNTGSIDGSQLIIGGAERTFSGSGGWKFGAFVISAGQTVALGSDVTFDINNFSNGGTLDVRNRTLTLTGGNFQSGGAALGTGTIRFAPISGNATFSGNGPAVTIASGTVEYGGGGAFSGPLTIDAGTTFRLNGGGPIVNGDVTVNGTLNDNAPSFGGTFTFNGSSFTNNGSVTVNNFRFNNSAAPRTQSITGTGTWAGNVISIAGPSPSTLTLQNDVTFASKSVQVFSTLNLNGRVLTYTGSGNGAAFLYGGPVAGSGTVRMQPASGTSSIFGLSSGNPSFAPELKIVSGTVTANNIGLSGPLTVDPGATFSLVGAGNGIQVGGNVTNNGTVNVSGTGSPLFGFQGNTFTNNGSVATRVLFGTTFGVPPLLAQNLAGTGSWTGAGTALFVGSTSTSTVTLLNDVTYAGETLFVTGTLNTGAFTLTLPCTVALSPFSAGDIVGNVRRTNLAACPGAPIAFGNPFTTIQFTSGTPPTEITVNTLLGTPAGFPGAAMRTYLITPTGGSGYTATLRLHYLDSELNGNDESTLQLWRNNGTNWTPQGVSNRNTTQNWVEYNNVTQFSPWTLSQLTPTAASVSVSGRVSTPNGYGLRNAIVTLTDQNGVSLRAITGSFGFYRFDDVRAGETYVIGVTSKRFQFTPRVISVVVELTDVDFVSNQKN